MEINESCLEWVPYMPGTTVKEYPVLSRNVPLGIRTYCTPEQEYDVTAPTGIGPGGLMVQPAGKRVGVPVHPTEAPGGLQVESKYMTARLYKTIINMGTISVLISFPHPGMLSNY